MEGFLRRLAASPHVESFVLKGALMLRVWQCPAARPTVDADFLGRLANDVDEVARAVREVCETAVDDDGMRYDADAIRGERITEEADYVGVRLTFLAYLGKARVRMQLDVGFGDVVVPPPRKVAYPTILPDMQPPKLRVYSRESTVAEKFEAMVKLGELNSRMKDFFDIWALAGHYAFEGPVLAEALAKTFRRRGTEMPERALAFGDPFAHSNTKQTQWSAFLRKRGLEGPPQSFPDLIHEVAAFLQPPSRACARGEPFGCHWAPPGPWRQA
jgi:hypothetical protein